MDWISNNRDAIRNTFAEHIKKSTSKMKPLNNINIPTLKLSLDNNRTKRSDYTHSKAICQFGFKELLENDIVVQSLLASSILWKYWNHNILDVAITPLNFLNIEKQLEQVNKRLELIGPWSVLIGKYGTQWIKNFIFLR